MSTHNKKDSQYFDSKGNFALPPTKEQKAISDRAAGGLSRQESREHGSVMRGVLGIVFPLMMLALLFRVMSDQNPPTLLGFLQYLQDAKTIPIDWISTVIQYTFNTGIGWLDSFLNTMGSLFGVAIYISVGLINLVIFFSYIAVWFFAG